MGPDSANMVHRPTLEASISNNPELGWKTITKGKRSKKPVARNFNEITQVGNRSSKKLDGLVTKKLVSNGADRIPPKKRHVLKTPSELQTLALVREDPVSPQPHTPSPHGDSKPQSKVFCKSSVMKSRHDRVEDLDQKLYNPEEFSGIALLAAAAGIEEHSILEKADMSASREPVKCSISIEPQSSPQGMQVNEDVVVRELKAPKVDRLHWDLNLEMDAWEQPLDLSDHNLDVEKLEGDGCKVSAISMNDLAGQELSSNLDSAVQSHQVSSVYIDEQPGTESENVRETDAKDSMQNNEVAVLESSQHDGNINSVVDDNSATKQAAQSCDPTGSSGKVGSSVDDGRCSDVSQGDGSNTVVSKGDGNDSPYEDGELRFSTPCPWLETESDYGYNECVDYESDDADYPGSEVVEEAGSDGSLGVEKPGREASVPESNRGSCMNEDVELGGTGDKSKVSYFMRDNNLRGRDSFNRSGGIEAQNKRSQAYSRPTRDGGPKTFMDRQRSHFHVRERNGEDDEWSGQWGSRSNISSGYRGPAGRNYNRPRNIESNSQDHGQSRDYSSKAPFRVDNRRLPYEKDDFYRGRNRTATNSNRSMGNSDISRGNRNDSYDPSQENRSLSSNRIPRYFPRPEPTPSAEVSRNFISRKRFRSRSRSLSPCGERRYDKSRSPCANRKYYRSPDFRSPARVDRVSMPFHKPNFHADQPGSGRGHYSPKRNQRWVDDRNFVENPRHRSSPVRASERIGRFNSVGSDGRHKEENYFRPGNWPRRFPDVGAGRGRNFGDKYDDRRHWTRYSDANIVVGRCKEDEEDKFHGKIIRKDDDIRNTEHRDVATSFYEDGAFKE